MNIEIADRADLDRAKTLVSWLQRPQLDRVTITLPGLTATERDVAAVIIRRLFNDCGCAWGLTGLAVAAVTAFLLWPSSGPGIVTAVLSCLLAAVVGKLLGLAWSRRRLLALLHTLRAAA